MASVIAVSASKRSFPRLTRNSKLFKAIIKAIQDKKGNRIVSLDLRKIPEASADIFVVCEAGSSVQIKAIAENVEDVVKQHVDERPFKSEGYQSLKWVLIDYVNIVVHIMQPEARRFYQLEEMWHDAPSMEHEG